MATISGLSQFAPPFNGITTCNNCGAMVKVKRKISNYLLPTYILIRAVMGLAFEIHPDLTATSEILILVLIFFFQVRLISYEEINSKTRPFR